jgi:hypothetical protein
MKKFNSILIAFVMLAAGVGVGRLSAGSPDAPGGPGDPAAAMYTMEQVYQRIINGGASASAATFTEPSTPPGTGTMHDLNDVFNQIGMSAHVPRTTRGQCPCITPGDDGFKRAGALWPNPRFTDRGNGSVTDNLTGLIWLKNSNCFGTRAWLDAIGDANGLNSGECRVTDGSTAGQWRLPNIRELLSLIDYNTSAPAFPFANPIGSPFTNLQASVRYWSSTVVVNNSLAAWNVDFDIGTVNRNQPKTTLFYVWPVSGGQTIP